MSVEAAQAALDAAAALYGDALGVDGPALLRERAEILAIAPQGRVSAGGTCRLLQAGDARWVAVNLARRDDVELFAAWMGREWDGPVWDAIETALRDMTAEDAVDRAQLLGIPAAVAVAPEDVPVTTAPPTIGPEVRGGVVVDLSSLWAGPLCARLLGAATRTPIRKVESASRPDGARFGPPEFFQRMNGMKEQVTLDFDDRSALEHHLESASIVVTSARPRALEQLGIEPHSYVERGVLWVSITGYGYDSPWRDRVAFGDDAAVAGGAAVAAGGAGSPVFVGDAVADPMAGLRVAAVAARLHRDGAAAFVDVAMREAVAEAFTGPQYAAHDLEVA